MEDLIHYYPNEDMTHKMSRFLPHCLLGANDHPRLEKKSLEMPWFNNALITHILNGMG